MKIVSRHRKGPGEPIIPMINVIFLLLVFLMLSGSPGSFDPFDVEPVRSAIAKEEADAPDVLFVSANFDVAYGAARGEADALAAIATVFADGRTEPLQIKADAGVDTVKLLEFVGSLKAQGVRNVLLVTLVQR